MFAKIFRYLFSKNFASLSPTRCYVRVGSKSVHLNAQILVNNPIDAIVYMNKKLEWEKPFKQPMTYEEIKFLEGFLPKELFRDGKTKIQIEWEMLE